MKKSVLLAGGLTLMATAANAQQLRGPESDKDTRECYVTWPSSYSLDQYINDWVPGQPMTKNYGSERAPKSGTWEDEEFFISRVKLRPLISNTATQIDETKIGARDKNLVFWVPCGMSTGNFQTGSLPNGVFDSEVFSTWSYVTHYGNWTSPYGWVPGAFADAAHKHGVLVSGVASVPNASMPASWRSCLLGMNSLASTDEGMEKIGKFLRYHGSDGIGYNSEWTGNWSQSEQSALSAMHGKLIKYMLQYQDRAENIWYGGSCDYGSVSGWGEGLGTRFYNTFGYSDEPRTVFFSNYNWNSAGYYAEDKAAFETTKRDSRDLYLGMNMQGGTRPASEWKQHEAGGQAQDYSIGLWGAHDKNMLFPARTNAGGSDALKQKGYQEVLEQWFTNGKRNPLYRMEVGLTKSAGPTFHGMSRLMNARSAYGWSLDDEPFITYFSLGNGNCYRLESQVMYPNEWYNLGMQDYTPTWRWWWADKFLGKEETDIPANSMTAEFSWDDAWTGGSSLKVSGSTAAGETQYLHLFKTQFAVKNNDVITIRYKILKGNGDINFVYSKLGAEGTEVTPTRTAIHTTSKDFFYDEWYTVELKVAARGSSALSAGDWAMLGLKFANAKDLEVLIGEMSIKRGSYKTPEMPVIRSSKVLSDVVSGMDAKLFWSMPNNAAPGEPVYNLDVNVSHFELWAQVEGGEPQFMGTTTSWAGLMFKIQNPEHKSRVRLGVQAVGLDHKSKSGITWTADYLTAPAHEVSETVNINKACIKPGEEFRIWFVDELHENATLSLYSMQGEKVATNNGASRELVASLDGIGAYDLVANEGTSKETRYSCFAQVSDFSVGRLPEIESLTFNGKTASEGVSFGMGQEFKAGYTGRTADGSGSRAIANEYKVFGCPVENLNLGENKSFSVSYWIRPTYYPSTGQLNMFGIEDRTGSWPENNWGFFWSEVSSTGAVSAFTKRGNSSNTAEYQYEYASTTAIPVGAWTHVAIVFDYDASNALLMKLYLNGVYQVPTRTGMGAENKSENNVDNNGIPVRGPNRSTMRNGMWMHIYGGRGSEPGSPDAILDDVTVWDGSIDETDIAKAMVGLDANDLPSNVKCFWDFEDEPQNGIIETRSINGKMETIEHNGRFMSKGQITGAPFGVFELKPASNEGQSVQTNVSPTYDAGCPYVKGTGFKVETKPTWSTRQATISNANGSDTEGEATVVYGAPGEKVMTLKLANSWGEDNATYPVIDLMDAIDGVMADAAEGVKAYSINKTIFVKFAEDGEYEVNVYNMSGVLMGRDARAISAGEMMHISIGQAGVYVIQIMKDGKELRNIKVVNK